MEQAKCKVPCHEDRHNPSCDLEDLARKIVTHFIQTVSANTNSTIHNVTKDDTIHGVAVWGLASSEQDTVQYHLDYAELIRYEYNVMVPPVLAGTLHCTPGTMVGGAFAVNLQGMKHYETHGYKGKLSGDDMAGYQTPPQESEIHVDPKTQWMTIPYRYNRLICHSGQLPHLSTPIESLPSPTTKRVILGFNFFCHDVGPTVQQAPEHSKAFRKRVQLSQCLRTISLTNMSPVVRHLLVLAKRRAIQQKLKVDQALLTECILQQIPCTVQQLMETCSCLTQWPRMVDVHVHVHHLVKNGQLIVATNQNHEHGLISTDCTVNVAEDADCV